MKDKINHESSDVRGCSLVTSCACEIAWLSRHIFFELVKLSSSSQFGAERRVSIYKDVVDNHLENEMVAEERPETDRSKTKKAKPKVDILAGMKEWILEYPTENELKMLYREQILWKQYKEKVIKVTKDAITNKR